MLDSNYKPTTHRFCVAPMLDWTDRHDRFFLRLISRKARLYTEMITTGALIHGDANEHLRYSAEENPIALQLGGSDPKALALCAKMGQRAHYDEINLNIGCPSNRVQNGSFGACLMANPALVATCVEAMQDAVTIPISIKTRIGIDDRDSFEDLCEFISMTAEAGCELYIIHARKAWLKGLSPKQNRTIPPLNYDRVFQLKKEFPKLTIVLNGGITSLSQGLRYLNQCDGIMMGREAYQNPYLLADVDQFFFDSPLAPPSRQAVLEQFYNYMENELSQGTPLKHMTRHILGLFHEQPGAKKWRRHLSENAHKPGSTVEIVREAAKCLN